MRNETNWNTIRMGRKLLSESEAFRIPTDLLMGLVGDPTSELTNSDGTKKMGGNTLN